MAEMWERFSYYGIASLLIFYLTEGLGLTVSRAAAICGLFSAACWLWALLGGLVADRLWGQERTLMAGGLVLIAGHVLMAGGTPGTTWTALLLISLGTGLFKTNSTAMVGALYAAGDPRRDSGYRLFYMGINVGSLTSILICGYLSQRFGWVWGLSAAGWGMALGLGFFVWGRRYLPSRTMQAATHAPTERSRRRLPALDRAAWRALGGMMCVALTGNLVANMALEQVSTSLNLFARDCVDLRLPGTQWAMPPSWLAVANPAYVLVLTPWLVRRGHGPGAKRAPLPFDKFAWGLLLLAGGFAVLMAAALRFATHGPVGLVWMAGAYLLLSWGEIVVIPLGFSTLSRVAPQGWTGSVMSMWMASVALSSMLGGWVSGYIERVERVYFFAGLTALAVVGSLVMLWLVPWLAPVWGTPPPVSPGADAHLGVGRAGTCSLRRPD